MLHEEYAFAGHPFDDTGVYEMTPRKEEEVCSDVKYRYDICIVYSCKCVVAK